jgi:2-oxo-4-hydroxy-4-carboxy--5-ureidoimidazoline (OHCU) decarboxylase
LDDAKPHALGAGDLARQVLDAAKPAPEREAIIRAHPELAIDLVAAMAGGLGADRDEEYRRIPWIWRVAIAVGRRNDAAELRRLLAVSLPTDRETLAHWLRRFA